MSKSISFLRLAALLLLAFAVAPVATSGTAEASTGCLPGSIQSPLNQIRANGPRVHFHKCQGASGKVYASRSSKSKRYAANAKSSKRYAAKSAPAKAKISATAKVWKTASIAR